MNDELDSKGSAEGLACKQVDDALAEVLDGTAPPALLDHVAECDRCRDVRHDAERAAELVGRAGRDFRPPADFAESLVARLEQRIGARGDAPEAGAPAERTEVAPVRAALENASQSAHDEAALAAVPPPTGDSAPVDEARKVTDPHASAPIVARTSPRPAVSIPVAPKPRSATRSGWMKRGTFAAAAFVAVAAATAAGFLLAPTRKGPPVDGPVPSEPWTGTVESVARAAADRSGGLESCTRGACTAVAKGAAIPAGATLRTDSRTRARVRLADGTELALDRATELAFVAGEKRVAVLARGTVVAEVAHADGAAHLRFPSGDVEILGTKLVVTASDDRASVEVVRGHVRVHQDRATVDVRAGEEATLVRGAAPVVASTASLADTLAWSDRSPDEADAPALRGLGELRARKPGDTKEKDRAVRLAKHDVKVRIVDVVARTEVDETFTNDTNEELEGIFRFPLPPGAQIERLALEVEGKLVEGAFVDRDKGAAIWRGVIQNAAPRAPKPKEEIIWVPGPWRDPALLEWQRGGRFELKIFPIPRKGSRRVVLAYTEVVPQSGGIRRYAYPLAHDPTGTTTVGSFDLDVQVLGADRALGVTTRGYDLTAVKGDAERRRMHADGFIPAGDLTVEYALPNRDKEVTAWGFRAPDAEDEPPPQTKASARRGKVPADVKAAEDAALAEASDASPFVAIALRPKLPRFAEAQVRTHVVVVDASRSMVGERFARARHLASQIVREMDRRDEVTVLACDTTCTQMPDASGATKLVGPGAASSELVDRFLGSIEPDGGSDLLEAMRAAKTAAGAGRAVRIAYLGDGTPTVGPTRPAHLELAVSEAMGASRGGDLAVVAVALGADADTVSLGALARGGGGVVVPYVPGQRVASAALDVLAASYGVMLRDVELELPAGLSRVTPARLDPIRAGGEAIVVARMDPSARTLAGSIKLRGRVAGDRFDQSYPVSITASTSAGNAFVPRLYAAARIAELEQRGAPADKPTAIALSKRFAVASRFTSLLVLESQAMFRAFGLDRVVSAATFTGEDAAESTSADGDVAVADDGDDKLAGGKDEESFARAAGKAGGGASPKHKGGLAGLGRGSGGHGDFAGPMGGAPRDELENVPAAPPIAGAATAAAAEPDMPPPPPRPSPHASPAKMPRNAVAGPSQPVWRDSRRRTFVPMKKVFDRKAAFSANALPNEPNAKIAAAEAALAAAPDSRDKTAGLVALYAAVGRVGEAQELTAKWASRDALDPEALAARSDLAARQGDRGLALRILGGLADVRPTDRAVLTRLAQVHELAGNAFVACEHRVALADVIAEARPLAEAITCARQVGMNELAARLLADAPDRVRSNATALLLAKSAKPSGIRGDVRLTASWTGGDDVDLALVDAQGRRLSWLGSGVPNTFVSAVDAASPARESLGFVGLPSGTYLVELTRASQSAGSLPVTGEVVLTLPGETRKASFRIDGARTTVGTVRVFFTSRLVPVGPPR